MFNYFINRRWTEAELKVARFTLKRNYLLQCAVTEPMSDHARNRVELVAGLYDHALTLAVEAGKQTRSRKSLDTFEVSVEVLESIYRQLHNVFGIVSMAELEHAGLAIYASTVSARSRRRALRTMRNY